MPFNLCLIVCCSSNAPNEKAAQNGLGGAEAPGQLADVTADPYALLFLVAGEHAKSKNKKPLDRSQVFSNLFYPSFSEALRETQKTYCRV